MKHFGLLAAVVLSFPVAARNWELPKIGADVPCQVALLLSVRDVVPWVFEEGAEYDVDMIHFIGQNRTLAEYLMKQPAFEPGRAQHGKRLVIEVGTKAAGGSEDVKMPPPALQERLFEWADEWDKHPLLQVTAELLTESMVHGRRSTRGVLLGIASNLPANDRAALLALRDTKAIASHLKRTDIPFAQFLQTFQFGDQDLDASQFNQWSDVFNLVSEIRHREESLVGATLHLMAPNHPNRTDALSTLMRDPRAALDAIAALSAWTPAQKDLLVGQLSTVLGIKAKGAKKPSKEKSSALTLVEVPPFFGAFRGLVGGDCASQVCFAYSYLPAERTFFIYDANDKLLGYAMLTELLVEGQPGWYLHDVTGNRLGVRAAETIIHAMYAAAAERGRTLVLPTAEHIHAINNHKPLIDLQQAMVKGAAPKSLQYPDAALRQALPNSGVAADASYDGVQANQIGFAPHLKRNIQEQISITVTEAGAYGSPTPSELTPGTALLLALDLLTSARLDSSRETLQQDVADIAAGGIAVNKISYAVRAKAARQVADLGGVDYARVAALNEFLSNRSMQPLSRYYQSLRAQFEAAGVDNFEAVLEQRPYLFYEGHLRAPDSARNPNADLTRLTREFAVALIRRWPNPELAYHAIRQAPADFLQFQKMANLVKALRRRPEDNAEKLTMLSSLLGDDFAREDEE